MAPSILKSCEELIDGYRAKSPGTVVDGLVPSQANRASMVVDRLRKPGVLALPDPVGTGKTIVALAAVAVLMDRGNARQVLVVAPNQTVAKIWLERANQMNRGISSPPFTTVRLAEHGIRWRSGELRVVTRRRLAETQRPKSNDTVIVVDEAHRGLQEKKGSYLDLRRWAVGQRLLLVTATPFQMSTSGLLTMLSVSEDDRMKRASRSIDSYGRALTQLVRRCAKAREDGLTDDDIERDPTTIERCDSAARQAPAARASLERFVPPPHPFLDDLPHHPVLLPTPATRQGDGGISPTVLPLGGHALAHHAARAIPELLDTGKGDQFNRQLVSSAEGFWASEAGKRLTTPDAHQLDELALSPADINDLARELRSALGTGCDHPKIAATTAWITSRVRQHRHVLVFCVYAATRDALVEALTAELGRENVSGPPKDVVPPEVAKRFRTEPSATNAAMVLVAQDRFSESIDLDGGEPCLVHHDLPWNPARLSQRWGRVVRASSNFTPVAVDDIYIPVLDTEVDLRLYETVRGRSEIGGLLLPRDAGFGDEDSGASSIPPALMKRLATAWRQPSDGTG